MISDFESTLDAIDAASWFTAEGWSTAHELRSNGQETLCGSPLRTERRRQAPSEMRRCGQCLRRSQ